MSYRVTIKNEAGQSIEGLLTYLDQDGDKIGETIIPVGGTELPGGAVELAYRFRITAPGYAFYGTSQLYDVNEFTLVKDAPITVIAIMAIIGGFVLGKLIKL